jgi:putative redox protein
MKNITTWQGKMRFEASDGEHSAVMDAPAPFGDGKALSPKQLLLASICGCTGVDVSARMRKHKQEMTKLIIEAEALRREGKPATFDSVTLDYFFEGVLENSKVIEAVVSSQTQDCGVSAMIAAHCPIYYRVHLNGDLIKEGKSEFKL